MVERAALEKRYTRKGIVSSNLTPAALDGIKKRIIIFYIKNMQQIIIYILGVFVLGLAFWLFFLEMRLKKTFGGKKAGDLENFMKEIMKEIQQINKNEEEIGRYLETVEKRLRAAVQHVGIVRFNPFQDAGGDQSFAVALMDEHKNGIVISSLYGRENSRIYSKPLEKGNSQYQLSKEEKQAIDEALK